MCFCIRQQNSGSGFVSLVPLERQVKGGRYIQLRRNPAVPVCTVLPPAHMSPPGGKDLLHSLGLTFPQAVTWKLHLATCCHFCVLGAWGPALAQMCSGQGVLPFQSSCARHRGRPRPHGASTLARADTGGLGWAGGSSEKPQSPAAALQARGWPAKALRGAARQRVPGTASTGGRREGGTQQGGTVCPRTGHRASRLWEQLGLTVGWTGGRAHLELAPRAEASLPAGPPPQEASGKGTTL